MTSRDRLLDIEHEAWAPTTTTRPVAKRMVGFGQQSIERELAHEFAATDRRAVDREEVAHLDCPVGQLGRAEPPVKYHAAEFVLPQEIDQLFGCCVAVQRCDARLLCQDFERRAQRFSLGRYRQRD